MKSSRSIATPVPETSANAEFPRGDVDVARKLAAERADEMERRRHSKHLLRIKGESTLAEYAAYHLEQKAAAGAATEA